MQEPISSKVIQCQCFTKVGKPLLVLVNPHGGDRTAVKMVRDVLTPMAKASGVQLDVVQTTHAGHAREIATSFDADK